MQQYRLFSATSSYANIFIISCTKLQKCHSFVYNEQHFFLRFSKIKSGAQRAKGGLFGFGPRSAGRDRRGGVEADWEKTEKEAEEGQQTETEKDREKAGGSVPRTAAERCSQSVHGQQIGSGDQAARHGAKHVFPEGEHSKLKQRPQSPSAIEQTDQGGGDNRDVTSDQEPLQQMNDKVHAKGEEQRQPRIANIRPCRQRRDPQHQHELFGCDPGKGRTGNSAEKRKQAGKPARKTMQEPLPMALQPGRQEENLFGLMQHEHRRKQP